jgi:hypothetical protein
MAITRGPAKQNGAVFLATPFQVANALCMIIADLGRLVYQKQRIREGATSFTASPWAANGKIFALSEDGDTFVFQAGPEYKLLHTNALDEMCMATPAIAGPRLLIRTLTRLHCLREMK